MAAVEGVDQRLLLRVLSAAVRFSAVAAGVRADIITPLQQLSRAQQAAPQVFTRQEAAEPQLAQMERQEIPQRAAQAVAEV